MKTPEHDVEFPIEIHFKNINISEFAAWFANKKADLNSKLLQSGAILFKGLAIETSHDFESLMNSIGNTSFPYINGNSPRTKISKNVYTSTEHDATQSITLHNELSYTSKWPDKLYFCCITPSYSGGETPIADSRKILEKMNSDIVEEILNKKIKYIRNLHSGLGVGPSWQQTFESQSKSFVDRYCSEHCISQEWRPDGTLRLMHFSNGIIAHPLTSERVWFNQIDQFHPSHLDVDVYESLLSIYNSEEDLPLYVSFGDGSSIPSIYISEIHNTIEALQTSYIWEKGDLLMIDNVLTCHGRKPFTGERKVLVSME